MRNIIEQVAIYPSLVRERWLPIDVAIQEMVEFERAFGTEHLLLACHSAFPSYLTPDLINLIRINFLDSKDVRIPWLAESDVLLSPFCRPLDDILFEVEPMIREVLLFELEERFGWGRLQELASFLLGYLNEKQVGRLRPGVAQVQEWIAQSYLNPDLVVQELKKLLIKSVEQERGEHQTFRDKFQVATTTELLAEVLERTTTQQQEYFELVHSTRLLARVLYGKMETLRFADASKQTEIRDDNKLTRLYPPEIQRWIRTIVRNTARISVTAETPLLEISVSTAGKSKVEGQLGKSHATLSVWLSQSWLKEGPPVCFVEGFSGVGKTSLARALMLNPGRIAVMVDMPDTGSDQFDDLLLDLASELSFHGIHEMANAVDSGTSLPGAFEGVLRSQILIVVDEFQRALDAFGRPMSALGHLLERIAKNPNFPGRLLLLSNRRVARDRCSEAFSIRTLSPLEPEASELLLDSLLEQANLSQEVPHERRKDIVNWLGCNPRAIHVLVASLEQDGLDELIGLNPESWELRDRQVSPELLERLERELLERTLSHLKAETNWLLRQLSVHRKSVKRDVIEKLLPAGTSWASTRDELISYFLMEQHSGWFTLYPIVREISLQQLKQNPTELRQAHSKAADHYIRRFTAKNIVGGGQLGGYFVEARYHLVQAQREKELSRIAGLFENHLKEFFTSVSPIPKEPNEINERIAVLSALLETPGSKGLEDYLARLYVARGAPNDLPKALTCAQRATGPRAPAASWVLRIKLEGQINGTERALQIAREGIDVVPIDQSLYALYQSCGELLAQAGRLEEAISLLKEGIDRIPANQSLYALYQSYIEFLAEETHQSSYADTQPEQRFLVQLLMRNDPTLDELLNRRKPKGEYEISEIELVITIRQLKAKGDIAGMHRLSTVLLNRCAPELQRHTWGLRHRPDLREEAIANMNQHLLSDVLDPKEVFITQNFIHYVRCLCVDEFNRVLRQEGLRYQRDDEGRPTERPHHVPHALIEPLQPTPTDSDVQLPTANVADPLDQYEHLHANEESLRILTFLSDPLDRKIMVLRAIEHMKWDDIAVICKRTERTIRLRYERARSYLRECILREQATNMHVREQYVTNAPAVVSQKQRAIALTENEVQKIERQGQEK